MQTRKYQHKEDEDEKIAKFEKLKRLTSCRTITNPNVAFYQGKIRCVPDGDFIDVIHAKWFGDFALLEFHHGTAKCL